MYYNYNYCTLARSTNLSNHWRQFYYCTTTESDKLRTLIQKPNLYYCTVAESAKLQLHYCIVLGTICTLWTKIQHVSSKNCHQCNTPVPKTFCISCILLLYISCIIHHYMTLCNYITGVQKLFELEVIDRLTLLSLELRMQLNHYYLLKCYYS